MTEQEKDLKQEAGEDVNTASNEIDPSLKEESETSDDSQETSESKEESEETIESLKAKLEEEAKARKKAEEDRDNYKKGFLSIKTKERSLSKPESKEEDISKKKVLEVLEEQNEKTVLRESINPESKLYLPELVDDAKYNEIIEYLPRTYNRSTAEGIHRALRIAINSWKMDKGLIKTPKDKEAQAKLASQSSEGSGEQVNPPVKKKSILPKSKKMEEWY